MVDDEGEGIGDFAMEETRKAAHEGADVVHRAIRHGKRRPTSKEAATFAVGSPEN